MNTFVLDGRLNSEKRIPLLIPANYFVAISFTTQADFEIEICICDEKEEYFTSKRQSTEVLPIVNGAFWLQSDQAELVIRIQHSRRIDARMDDMEIKDDAGNLINRTISLVAEDSYDYDYNDVLLTISAWKSRG